MLCYKDKTYCSSNNHEPDCHRKITPKELKHAEKIGLPIAWANFCDKNE